jgi:TM2 domain-containing membrane protein YozV
MNLAQARDKKVICGVLGLLIGSLGIHKFVLGNTKEGVIMLLLCFTIVLAPVMGIIGFIEGIIYLTKTDEEFLDTYINGDKGWF